MLWSAESGEAFYTEVLTALRKKNESWYQIVWAVCVEELSQEEAAERLGISPEILRAKLYRARKIHPQEVQGQI